MAGETVVMEETCKIEDPSDEIVLDQKMHDDIQEIVNDILSEYPRDLLQWEVVSRKN